MNSFSAATGAKKAETDACLVKPSLHLISLSQMSIFLKPSFVSFSVTGSGLEEYEPHEV